ncbi:MAG: ABC transporter permease [Chloroflexi bacterium]|nr:ABC transporter permease [Chloroflexota bacterium]
MSTESRSMGAAASQSGAGMSQAAADLAADDDLIHLPPELSPFRRAIRRFLSHKLALAGFICLINMALLASAQAVVSPFDPEKPHLFKVNRPPDTVNWMGTDQVGRDVFSRILQGARVSLSVGIVAVSIYVVIGFIIGSIAGLAGGYIDDALMRFTDFVMTFPTFILIIILAGITGPNIFNIMVIIGIFGWPGLARLFRGNILVMRELEYVMASRTLGASQRHIIARHILPNIVGPVTVAITLGVAGAILAEAGLSFLGFGVTEPAASWGSMINSARGIAFLAGFPWLWIAPGAAISIAVLSINFMGDGLRDAFDVRGRSQSGE